MFGLGVVVLGTGTQRFGARPLWYRAHLSPRARAEISGHLVISLRCARRRDDPEGYTWIRSERNSPTARADAGGADGGAVDRCMRQAMKRSSGECPWPCMATGEERTKNDFGGEGIVYVKA
jgi:hypothetical protein